MKIQLILLCFFLLKLFSQNCIANTQPQVTEISESLVTSDACSTVLDTYYYLNGLSYQQDAVLSFNNWQYVAYYNAERFVTLARRQLPNGEWQHLTFTDYQQSRNDSHNTISLGMAPKDGTLHVAFDHHDESLNYRKSNSDVLTDPEHVEWKASIFSAVQDHFVEREIVTSVTYPRFLTTPDNNLLFICREGGSGDGRLYMWEYSGEAAAWQALGKVIDNPNGGNAYLNSARFDESGRLHVSWVKRESTNPETNHDLFYMYSDDSGHTWKDNSGQHIGQSGSSPVIVEQPQVWAIPMQSGLINQESQTIDHAGRVHVLLRKDVNGENYQFHYWRDVDGTWHETNTHILTSIWYQRSKILVDSQNNVYAFLPGLLIASASAALQWLDWQIINRKDDNRFFSEPLYDWHRLHQGDGILSVLYQEKNSGNLFVLDYRLNDASSVKDNSQHINPAEFLLKSAFPNPFNPSTTIQCELPEPGAVSLKIYDIQGRVVYDSGTKFLVAGQHNRVWNGVNTAGEQVAAGVYLYRVEYKSQSGQKQVMMKKTSLVK